MFARVRDMSADGTMKAGILRGIEDGWFMAEIAEAAFTYQVAVEKGEKKVVGVNTLTRGIDVPLEILRVSHEVESEQVRELGIRKAARDETVLRARLVELAEVARGEGNSIQPMLAAIRAEATLGEVCGVLRELWGSYTEPPRF
ncbi:MAG: methylmalonyl-CoA mutase family protein [Mycobacteriales bacterium]